MTIYQIAFLFALYAAIQGRAYLEHCRNKINSNSEPKYGFIVAARFTNLFVVSVGLIAVFFHLGTLK